MAQYKITINGLDKLNKAFKEAPKIVYNGLANGIRISVNMIRPMMVRNAPVKTSKLRQNIYATATGLRGEVGPNLNVTPYALFVHEGTRAHEIRPVKKQALFWKGALHPVKLVHHPGTKANPFVERTAEEMNEPISNVFKNITEKIVNQLAQ